jgi:predicted NAD/FAD-binding protein
VTVTVASAGTTYDIDAGFLLLDDWQYPTFSALLGALRVPVEPVGVSISYAGRHGTWSTFQHDTPLFRRVREEAIRFSREAPAIAMLARNISLAQYLTETGYSQEFQHACLLPLIGVLFVNRAALFEIPAWIVGAGFARFFSFFSPMTCFRIRGGAQAYLRELASRCRATMRLETPVASIVRDDARVVVHDARGNAEVFDHVILSVDACTALQLLDRPSPQERAVLGAARLDTTQVQVHTDPTVRSADTAPWAFFNYRDLPNTAGHGGAGQCTVDVLGKPDGPFVTWDAPDGAIDPGKCVARLGLDHVVYSTQWAQILTEQFPALQGVQRTWFCGGHSAGFPSHEGALVSGIAVACALGAGYPFSADRRALAAYHQIRRQYPAGARRDLA